MRVLIIGNDPGDTGGVANYTRPLALKFKELGHDVFYFYSGAWNRTYNWLLVPYFRIDKKAFPFECVEVVNSPSWAYNYKNPLLDIKAFPIESLFSQYLKRIKPQIMHVHSRLGLPASLIEVASKQGVKVFNTIHTYGFLCQKRVLIDNNGFLCEGPVSLEKCVECRGFLNVAKLKFIARMKSLNENFFKAAVKLKRTINKFRPEIKELRGSGLNQSKSKEKLQERLNCMIRIMNEVIVMNICVSNDVKKTLIKHGVKENKLLVQHIGSGIAEKQKFEQRCLRKPIVIGNIGGAGYYKGTHILIEAVSMLKGRNFSLKIFGRYDQAYVEKIMRGKEALPIKFFGRYKHEDLPDILKQIDIMVLPSICNDTAPQTIFESYSAGIPIIASNIGGLPDFMKDGVNGYLFQPGNVQDLTDKIESILSDPGKISEFSANTPKLKTISENVQELISLYKREISNAT